MFLRYLAYAPWTAALIFNCCEPVKKRILNSHASAGHLVAKRASQDARLGVDQVRQILCKESKTMGFPLCMIMSFTSESGIRHDSD